MAAAGWAAVPGADDIPTVARYVIRFARRAGIAVLFILAAMAGTVTGFLFAFADDIPQISALDDYAPSTITRVHSVDGQVIGEFAVQRREVVGYNDISPLLRRAIIAAEDQDFDSHVGLSVPRIMVTAVKDVLYGQRAGGSTLTQQLAKNLFLTNEKTWERKVKEAILTIQIEKRYTKREIFTLYCNHIPWGHGTYGAEAASRLYFDKPAKNLTLEEAALLAGIVQAPARQSPYVSVERAKRRRNYALQRMAHEGFITAQQAEAASKLPILTSGRPASGNRAPFFTEAVRQHLEERYGAKQLYENGLTVRTSLDLSMQRAAEAAVDAGLRALDKRRGWRKPARNVVAAGHDLDRFADPRWKRAPVVGHVVPAVVTDHETASGAISLRIDRYRATLARAGYAWTRQRSPRFLERGDVVEVRITAIDEAKGVMTVSLEQSPLVEGALVAIDNHTGQVRAMVGGFSFERTKFNRATQAHRQLGSTFKPIVFTAAIDRGFTPASTLIDSPVAFDGGPRQPPYAPQNYDHTFKGPITLRYALEQSRNVPTVRLVDELGVHVVIDYARRLGITSPLPPYLSLALGSAEATLLEIASAYTAFPNQGVRMRPYTTLQVLDREGNLLEENRPEPREAIRADTAFVITNLLRGVTLRGTAAAAASLDWPVAGKTGTMDEYTDAWFIGFDPDITVGVWVGYDEKKPLGRGETGAQAALPIWMAFMKAYIETRRGTGVPEFSPPGNIVFRAVDRSTGAPIGDATNAINEAFISGTEPR
jgi:penicillin-binding protein 1A